MSVDYIPSVIFLKQLAEYIKPQFKKIGVDVRIRPSADFPTWAKRISSWDFDVTADAVFNWGDPVIGVARTYLCKNIRKGVIWSNTQSYCNPRVDDILGQATIEMDIPKRKALYAEFQRLVVDEVPVYSLFVIPYHTVYDKNLRNIPTTIWGTASPLDEVYFEKLPN
jgi:peptide/nickel transport system substrate-binding protein